ncbi:MAG: 16S rRNA pseudouridine(516) synthase, partial [Eubacterium sp.]|nr:16S rRNA pseudouridine(516) synthase [Eubacterium sp.]
KHVDKTYIATLDKPFTEEVKCDFESGMELGGKKLQKAELDAVDGDFKTARVVLREGMYHQVKRMFKKHGITVVELKRTKIGSLELDKALAEGESRYITETELQNIRNS